jgi:hypothetical protein
MPPWLGNKLSEEDSLSTKSVSKVHFPGILAGYNETYF